MTCGSPGPFFSRADRVPPWLHDTPADAPERHHPGASGPPPTDQATVPAGPPPAGCPVPARGAPVAARLARRGAESAARTNLSSLGRFGYIILAGAAALLFRLSPVARIPAPIASALTDCSPPPPRRPRLIYRPSSWWRSREWTGVWYVYHRGARRTAHPLPFLVRLSTT